MEAKSVGVKTGLIALLDKMVTFQWKLFLSLFSPKASRLPFRFTIITEFIMSHNDLVWPYTSSSNSERSSWSWCWIEGREMHCVTCLIIKGGNIRRYIEIVTRKKKTMQTPCYSLTDTLESASNMFLRKHWKNCFESICDKRRNGG